MSDERRETRDESYRGEGNSPELATEGSGFFKIYEPDPVGILLGSPYRRFDSGDGVRGLALVRGARLDLLVVETSERGTGQFRRFIARAKETFGVIGIWAVWSEPLRGALLRYGFRPAVNPDIPSPESAREDGLDGFEWRRP